MTNNDYGYLVYEELKADQPAETDSRLTRADLKKMTVDQINTAFEAGELAHLMTPRPSERSRRLAGLSADQIWEKWMNGELNDLAGTEQKEQTA